MTTHDARRSGRAQVLVGLVAWLVLTLIPVLHGPHPGQTSNGIQTDHACALCAVSAVPGFSSSASGVHAPSLVAWVQHTPDHVPVTGSCPVQLRDRAPPAFLV